MEQKKAYSEIIKATSIFGGLEVFKILIGIIRTKVVAVFLGPLGMGISGLLSSSVEIVSSITGFGLGTSAVKSIAESYNNNTHEFKLARTYAIIKKLLLATGLLGVVVVIILSPFLSYLSFGNSTYSFEIACISCTLLINQISSGYGILLQGMRQISLMVKVAFFSSIAGLLLSLPLYLTLGINAIVPVLILLSLVTLFFNWFYVKGLNLEAVSISNGDVFNEGKQMLIMGFSFSLTNTFKSIRYYIIRLFISSFGGIYKVGLYTAGFAMIDSYTAMIFTAMGNDYYPRLASVSSDNSLSKRVINQQAEIAILILGPILVGFICLVEIVIVTLFSAKFLEVAVMTQWIALGIFFKAVSWSMSYIFLAKGVAKLFFVNELISGIVSFGCYIAGYYIAGLNGVGFAFLVHYVYYTIQVYIIIKKRYDFDFNKDLLKVFIFFFVIGILSFIASLYEGVIRYLPSAILIAVSILFSLYELQKRINFKERFYIILKKIKSKKIVNE